MNTVVCGSENSFMKTDQITKTQVKTLVNVVYTAHDVRVYEV